MRESIRFQGYPRTRPVEGFVLEVVKAFRDAEPVVGTELLEKGLTSDQVLAELSPALRELGFDVESGKRADQKIHRPVFFGEGGVPELRYEVDAFHPARGCGLEIEAGRAWMGDLLPLN